MAALGPKAGQVLEKNYFMWKEKLHKVVVVSEGDGWRLKNHKQLMSHDAWAGSEDYKYDSEKAADLFLLINV